MHERFARAHRGGPGQAGATPRKRAQKLDRSRSNGRSAGSWPQLARRGSLPRRLCSTIPAGPRGCASTGPFASDWDEWARYSEGCYVLRTNVTDWTAEDLWKTYIQLTEAEAAFRIHKTELSIRPVWHQRTERVQAHILVCFLAYVLWKTLEQWQSRAGLGNSPRTLLDELGRIQSADVVFPPTTRRGAAHPLRGPPRQRPGDAARSPGPPPSPAPTPAVSAPKCSANFSCNAPILRDSTPSNCGSWASPRSRTYIRSRSRVFALSLLHCPASGGTLGHGRALRKQ